MDVITVSENESLFSMSLSWLHKFNPVQWPSFLLCTIDHLSKLAHFRFAMILVEDF